jgi:predicted nucleic-acid-binding Zn-ribbon protein
MFKMAKKGKLSTPEWILEGYDSPEEYAKAKGLSGENKKDGKTFKMRECPKCGSDDVGVVLSGSDSEEDSNTGKQWECHKCKWNGRNVKEKELTEEELMQYLDKKGEEVA